MEWARQSAFTASRLVSRLSIDRLQLECSAPKSACAECASRVGAHSCGDIDTDDPVGAIALPGDPSRVTVATCADARTAIDRSGCE